LSCVGEAGGGSGVDEMRAGLEPLEARGRDRRLTRGARRWFRLNVQLSTQLDKPTGQKR